MADIGKAYAITRQTVYAILKKFEKCGTTADMPRSGRPRHTTPRDDSRIYFSAVRSPKKTPEMIKSQMNLNVSARTVRRRLNEKGLRPHMSAKVSYISAKNQKLRLAFAKKMVSRPKFWWDRVIWSDEKKFELMHAKRRVIVNRRRGQRYQIKFTKPTVKFGGGSLMLWGCFSRSGVGSLVLMKGKQNADKYRFILEDNLQYSADLMGISDRFVFQQDKCRIHWTPLLMQYFADNNIDVMEWPPQSADFNPIEHLWSYLDSKVPITERCNKTRFMAALIKTWEEIPQQLIDNLIDSIPRRLWEAIKAKGGPTRY